MGAAFPTSFLGSSGFYRFQEADPLTSERLVHLHRGQAITSTLMIAKVFQRRHGNVLRTVDSMIADGTIDRLNSEPILYRDAHGREQRMILLTETGAFIALPFLGGKEARAGQARIVHAFMAMREELRRQQSMEWREARANASVGFRMMSNALAEVRGAQGKATHQYHYANEAKMINKVVFGANLKLDRNCLSSSELALLEKVEICNAVLIAQWKPHGERMAALLEFVKPLRQFYEIRPSYVLVEAANSTINQPQRWMKGDQQ